LSGNYFAVHFSVRLPQLTIYAGKSVDQAPLSFQRQLSNQRLWLVDGVNTP
jgi:hypothetical protein